MNRRKRFGASIAGVAAGSLLHAQATTVGEAWHLLHASESHFRVFACTPPDKSRYRKRSS